MGRTFICGPPDSACWLYGTRVADKHMWETGAAGPWEHGEGIGGVDGCPGDQPA